MTIYPAQYFGIGDIIFTQTLVRRLADANPIVWGSLPHFVDDLNRHYEGVNFVDYLSTGVDYERRDQVWFKEMRYLPIRWADTILKVPYDQCMRAKYDMYHMDYQDWKEQAMWKRNKDREAALMKYYDKVPGDHYILINEKFQSDSKGNLPICNASMLRSKVVSMKSVPGFSLFDWAGIIEGAAEIHTVSTALLYILELLDLKQPIHLYPRPTDPKFKQVDYLFTKPYILH